MTARSVVAVDLGASSGRVILGRVGPAELQLADVHRFPNGPVPLPDGLHWDAVRLFAEIVEGLRAVGRQASDLVSIGVDGWGVDYGLLDRDGALIGEPYHYRDPRTEPAVEVVHGTVPAERLYARTGIQVLALNTVYQLASSRGSAALDAAAQMLLVPDLIAYWLTGVPRTEETNASTTGLLDVAERTWAIDLIAELELPLGIFGPIDRPGTIVGGLRDPIMEATGLGHDVRLTLVGSHDTASAVVGVPAVDDRFAYIACGTWSLVGIETDRPVLTEASRAANFTNEAGVDGRVRYLRNVMGLWLLQESMRTWEHAGEAASLDDLLTAAARLPAGGPRIDVGDPVLLAPGDMPSRVDAACRRTDQPLPEGRPGVVRCILDSLAAANAATLRDAVRLSGRDVDVVHLVGGGSRNALLCQLTADACGLPVVAGPAEATAIGNLLVQARAHGAIDGDLTTLRALVRSTTELRRYEPRATAVVGTA